MSTKVVECKIRGLSPLLINRFPLAGYPDGFQKMAPEEQAEIAAYRVPESRELYIPGIAIQRCLVNGGGYSKGKGRAMLTKIIAACVLVTPEYCLLGVHDYMVDSRPVVIQATRGRVMRHRPRLNDWETTFNIEYDPVLLSEDQLRKVVDDSGSRVGLLDFRPERKGPFGRFMVVSWM